MSRIETMLVGITTRARRRLLATIVIASVVAWCAGRVGLAQDETAPGASPATETPSAQPAEAIVQPAADAAAASAEPVPSAPIEAASSAPAPSESSSDGSAPTAPAPRVEKPVVIPIDFQPYRVSVSLSFDSDAQFSATYRSNVKRQLANCIERTYGRMWQVDIAETDRVEPASAVGIARLTADELRALATEGKYDKVLLLAYHRIGPRYMVSGCEWDAASDGVGDTVTDETWERSELAETSLELILRLFRPVTSIDTVDGYKAVVKVRAGAFPALDPRAEQVRPGDLLEPFFRYHNKDLSLAKVQPISFTYLVVEQLDGGRAECDLLSGLVGALGGRTRRRVDRLALRVRPAHPETRIELALRTDPTRVMRGMHVSVYPKTHLADQPDGPPLELVADRQGTIVIPTNPDRLLYWMYAQSGNVALARVPIVPGVRPVMRLELPDDSIRLECEGDVELLRGRIIAVVAERAALMAKIQALSDQGNWVRVKQEVAALDALPNIEQFESLLTAIREPALEAARRARDRKSEGRIQRLCTETSDLFKRYLDNEKLKTFKEGIEEKRKAVQDADKT